MSIRQGTLMMPHKGYQEDAEIQEEYATWKLKHNKLFSTIEENRLRFEIFKENFKLVKEVNSQNHGYTLELNETADLSYEEFSKIYNLFEKDDPKKDIFSGSDLTSKIIDGEKPEFESRKGRVLQSQTITVDWQAQDRAN